MAPWRHEQDATTKKTAANENNLAITLAHVQNLLTSKTTQCRNETDQPGTLTKELQRRKNDGRETPLASRDK